MAWDWWSWVSMSMSKLLAQLHVLNPDTVSWTWKLSYKYASYRCWSTWVKEKISQLPKLENAKRYPNNLIRMGRRVGVCGISKKGDFTNIPDIWPTFRIYYLIITNHFPAAIFEWQCDKMWQNHRKNCQTCHSGICHCLSDLQNFTPSKYPPILKWIHNFVDLG